MSLIMNRYNQCPCDTKLLYGKCCGKVHGGEQPANALALMRSRYSAYALNLAQYIMDTTHPDNPNYESDSNVWKRQLEVFCKHTRFLYLEIDEFIDGPEHASVTFTAHLSQNNNDATFTEKSLFVKQDGVWLYRDGEAVDAGVDSPPEHMD
jgi:SEC-C motif-containing protein